MKHVVVIPERFRLGDAISFKVRRVASIKADRLTVCCPVAWRFLFPTATDYVDVSETLDGWGERRIVAELKSLYPQAEFIKVSWVIPADDEFTVSVPVKPAEESDVIVVPRKKPDSSPHRDWQGWPSLVQELQKRGRKVLAVGRKDMSMECGLPLIESLDDIANALLKTRLVVSTDSGIAHLAILLRIPLAVLWGTPVGVIPGQDYKKGCHARMESQKRSPVYHVEGAWDNIQHAVAETLRLTA